MPLYLLIKLIMCEVVQKYNERVFAYTFQVHQFLVNDATNISFLWKK